MELYFRAKADFDEVIRLRQEIERLQKEIDKSDKSDKKVYRKLNRDLLKTEKRYDKLTEKAARNSVAMRKSGKSAEVTALGFSNLTKSLSIIGGTAGLVRLGQQIVNVRGEFQQLQVAFETMLNSKEKANKLMSEVVDFASKTPFKLSEVAGGTKQLLAYGVEAENVIPTLKSLGDVSAGLSVPIGRLILNYGQVKTQMKLTGRELRDFNMAGVPLIAELSKNLNKSEQEIQEMVSAGKIGFKEVENAFRTMSSEGGRFANLMDKQAKTITGRISNLGDNIEKMFNEIGQNSEGFINGAIDGANFLVEHYDKIGREVIALAGAYGTYKAVLITLNAIQTKRFAIGRMIVSLTEAEMLATKGLTRAEALAKLQKKGFIRLLFMQTKAQLSANAAALANPYVLVAAALAGLTYAVYKYATAETSAERATRLLNEEQKRQAEQTEKAKQEFNELIDTIKDETSTRTQQQEAYEKLQKLYPSIFKNMDIEAIKLAEKKGLLKEVNEEIERGNDLQGKTILRNIDFALSTNSGTVAKNMLKSLGQETSMWDITGSEAKETLKKYRDNLQKQINDKSKSKAKADFDALSYDEKIKRLISESEQFEEAKKNTEKILKTTNNNDEKEWAKKQIENTEKIILQKKTEIKKLKELQKSEKANRKTIQDVKKEIDKENKALKKLRKAYAKDTDNGKLKEQIEKKQKLINALNDKLKTSGVSVGGSGSRSVKEQKTPQQIAEEQLATQKRLADADERLQQEKQDRDFQIRQEQINNEKDLNKKRLAQIKLDAEIREKTIERNRKKALQQYREYIKEKKRQEHIVQNGDDKTFTFDAQKEITALPTDWNNQFNSLLKLNSDRAKDEADDVYSDLLKQYETYEQKKEAIGKKYADIRKNLEGKTYDKDKLAQDEAKELFEVEKGAGKIKNTISLVFSDLSEKTKEELDKIRQKGEDLYNALDKGEWNAEIGKKFGIDEETFLKIKADPEILKVLREKLDELKVSAKSFADNFKNLFKENISDSEFSQSLGAVVGKIQTGVQALNMFSDALRSINELTGDDGFGDIADSISATIDVANQTMQGAQMGAELGGAYGAAIGAGLGLVTGILNKSAEAEKRHREALNKLHQSNIQNQRVYNQLLFEQKMLMKGSENIFGVDELSKALGYLNLYNESYQKLQNSLKKRDRKVYLEGFGKKFDIGKRYQASDLDEIQIKTGHEKTGLFGWGKGRDVYSSITEKHKDLIKANGELNVELAKSLLQSKDFGKGGKEALQEIITQYENVEKAQKQFDGYLKSTLGELGSGLMDSVIHSLKTGEDAFESFGKSVGNVMLKLGKDMLYSTLLKDYFDDLSRKIKSKTKEIKEAGGDETDVANGIKDVIAGSMGELKGKINAFKGGMETYIDGVNKDLGIDVLEQNKRTQGAASYGTYEGITHEQASSIDGRLTSIQMTTLDSNDVLRDINVSHQKMAKHIALISGHTSVLPESRDLLKSIKKNTDKL